MRAFTSLLACTSAALFMATLPACATPPATPGGASWEVPHFTFEPMSAEKQAELRHAIADCAKVEMVLQWLPGRRYRTCSDKHWRFEQRTHTDTINGRPWKEHVWVRELQRGGELDVILKKLSAVQQWYAPVFDGGIDVLVSGSRAIRFLDAEGKVLYSESLSCGPWSSCAGEKGERISLSDFFPPFPDRNCFGK